MKSFGGLQTGMNGMGFNNAQNNYNPNFAYNNKEPFLQIYKFVAFHTSEIKTQNFEMIIICSIILFLTCPFSFF